MTLLEDAEGYLLSTLFDPFLVLYILLFIFLRLYLTFELIILFFYSTVVRILVLWPAPPNVRCCTSLRLLRPTSFSSQHVSITKIVRLPHHCHC